MRVLVFGRNHSVTNPLSANALRYKEYGALAEKIDIVVAAPREETVQLSPNVTVYAVAANARVTALFRVYQRAKMLMREFSHDIVTTRDIFFFGLLAYMVAHKFGAGFELQVHGFEHRSFLRERLFILLLKRADSVRVVSGRLQRELSVRYAVSEKKVSIIPIFVPCEELGIRNDTFIRKPEWKDSFVFLHVGRLVPVKRIDVQLTAIKDLVNDGYDVFLAIVGEGILRKRLEERMRELGLSERMKFYGHTNDPGSFYKTTDCLLFTSECEGWGLVPLEAACAGLPIIMTDVGCAGEALLQSERIRIINVNDYAALVGEMTRMIKSQGVLERDTTLPQLLSKAETLNRMKESWMRAMEKGGNRE